MKSKITNLMGKQYNPESFDCWSLVEELVPLAPKLDVIGCNYKEAIKEYKENNYKLNKNFNEVPLKNVRSQDIILVGHNNINHAGVIYIDSSDTLVIHNDKNGVHTELFHKFIKKYNLIRLLRCKNNNLQN